MAKVHDGRNIRHSHSPLLANSTLVRSGQQLSKTGYVNPKKTKQLDTSVPKNVGRTHHKRTTNCIPLLERKLQNGELSQRAINFISQYAWRDSTKKSYTTYVRKWQTFCLINGVNKYDPHIGEVVDFLLDLIESGAPFATVNIARCALSVILPKLDAMTVGKNDFVCWTVKGANEVNPSLPRYTSFWDVRLVLNLFRSWGRNSLLTLYRMTVKVTVLLLLLTAQRGQTVWRLNVSGLEFLEDRMIFRLKHLLKHNRPGDPLDTLVVPAYPAEKLLCPVRAVRRYLLMTKPHRLNKDQLLLSTKSPFQEVSRDSVSRWTKHALQLSGIDTSRFKPHSTRGAFTSKATSLGIDLNLLLRQASWKNADTFGRFYNKVIERVDETLAHKIISNR